MDYIEKDCTIEHNGHTFTALGAVITDNIAIGYMSSDMKSLTDWHEKLISDKVRIVAKWKLPRSYLSDCMYQVKIKINSIWYSGRTTGEGMVWKGKALKNQNQR